MSDVVILEDHKMFSMTFSSYLQQTGRFRTISNFDSVDSFLEFLKSYNNEDLVIILDYFLPDTDIEAVIGKINETVKSSKVLILTSLTSSILLRRLLYCNLAGVISKVDSPMEVINCLNNFRKGKTYLSVTVRGILNKSSENPVRFDLTNKETEILKLLSLGKTVGMVSDELNLSKHTVVTHRRNILAKSDFRSISEMIVYLVKSGMI